MLLAIELVTVRCSPTFNNDWLRGYHTGAMLAGVFFFMIAVVALRRVVK